MSNPFSARAPGSKLAATGIDFTPTIHSDTYDFIKPEQSVDLIIHKVTLLRHPTNILPRFDLSGHAVLITGASKGIGRETALSFARAGASHIAIGARSSLDSLKAEIEHAAQMAGKQAPQILILELDISDNASVEMAAGTVQQSFGRLDILINNAGCAEPYKSITDGAVDEWKKGWEVNVFGLYHMTRAFLPLLVKSGGGLKVILNLTSFGAHFVVPGGSGYFTNKLAILRFGEFVSLENPETVVYSVHPGTILTEMSKSIGEENLHLLTDTPRLAADTIVFLSAERQDWLNGRYVSATWDMKELLGKRKKIEDEDLLKVRLSVGLE